MRKPREWGKDQTHTLFRCSECKTHYFSTVHARFLAAQAWKQCYLLTSPLCTDFFFSFVSYWLEQSQSQQKFSCSPQLSLSHSYWERDNIIERTKKKKWLCFSLEENSYFYSFNSLKCFLGTHAAFQNWAGCTDNSGHFQCSATAGDIQSHSQNFFI